MAEEKLPTKKRTYKVRIQKVSETHVGKLLEKPGEQERHDKLIAEMQASVHEEVEALERSTRGNHRDPHAYFR